LILENGRGEKIDSLHPNLKHEIPKSTLFLLIATQLALRAHSLCSCVQIGIPADLSNYDSVPSQPTNLG